MDLAEVTTRVQSALGAGSGFTNKVKFDFGEVGKIFVDGTTNAVSTEDAPADTTIKIKLDDFIGMSTGALDPTAAFMQGKLKVEGDMGVAMQLQSVMAKLR